MLNSVNRIGSLLSRFLKLERSIDDIKINQAILLAEMGDRIKSSTLSHYEFKIFSQWGEDGILQFLTRNLSISNRTFIEFGVEDFFESNCRLLLMKDGWQGFVIDGSQVNIERLTSSYFYWRYPLQAISAFVTRENVSDLLDKSGFDNQCGVLSVDVDGVDWHLLDQLGHWNASIVVVEYNSVFGSRHPITVPYSSSFMRSRSHWSNLYWGASLPAFDLLLSKRGYSLVGVNSAGSNAFFVRSDLINDRIRPTTVADCFLDSRFRESRSPSGSLLFRTAQQSRDLISHLPVLDTVTQRTYSLGHLFEGAFSS
jgi:hypothetical protein